MADALRLAVSTPVSGYDAQFVSLAHALGVPLVTEDKELLKNFPSTSISMREFVSAG
jgi:predicted nucleic acid-binding protein